MHKSRFARTDKIKKDPNKPAPGDYDANEAFRKTQTKQFSTKMEKHKIRSVFEEYAFRKKHVPDPARYAVTQRSYDALSKSPVR